MKYYFLSDAHLGARVVNNAAAHQQKLIDWLEMAQTDATEIFLLGDIFDFWFEFPKTIPQGYDLLLKKLKQITQKGIPVHFFIGNHDIWTFGFLEKEIGLIVHKQPQIQELCGKRFFLAHGDGLGDKNFGFKLIRTIFYSRICQTLFRYLIPPRLGYKFGFAWSEHNRLKHLKMGAEYKGESHEPIVIFAKQHSLQNAVDYYVFGHRHIVLNLLLATRSQLLIIGDFMNEFSYAVFDGKTVEIKNFSDNENA